MNISFCLGTIKIQRCFWRPDPKSPYIFLKCHLRHFHFLWCTIQKFFLIWISRSFKKGVSDSTISYFDQSFRFSGLWLILARDLGRSGQNKSWGAENRESFFFLNFEQCLVNWNVSTYILHFLIAKFYHFLEHIWI